MKREIKFRAFIDGEMIDAESLAFEYYEPLKDQLSNCENLMQYTGLKDKIGIDIYEGDIVEIWSFDKLYRLGTVYFDNSAIWMIKPIDGQFIDINWLCHTGKSLNRSLVVIGNIYQNPELITLNANQ